MTTGRIVLFAAVILFVLVIVYVLKVKNCFAAIPRLARPWVVLNLGVSLLFLGVLLIVVKDVFGFEFGVLEEVDDAIIGVSSFFIFVAMVLMKRAWTVSEGE